ncbi:MAG TPA: MEDS domain-containing protein [Candidatus Bathyarchaeia archaeon]
MAAAAIITTIWGQLVTRLYLYPEKFTLRSTLANPLQRIHLAYLLYLLPGMSVVTLSWAQPSSIDSSPNREALYIFGGYFRSVAYSPLMLILAATLIIAFTIFPLLVLSRLRAQLKDREIRDSLRIIASSFALIATLLLIGNALSNFGYSVLGSVHFISLILLIVAVQAFKKPTFLKAFLGVLPSLEAYASPMKSDQVVLVYKDEESRFHALSRFVNEGVSKEGLVLYFYNGDETDVREELSRLGVNVKLHMTKGNLRLISLGNLYQSKALIDEEAAISTCGRIVEESRTLRRNRLSILIEYGDIVKRPYQKFVSHLADPRWTSPDHYVKVLMTFAKHAFEGQGQLDLLKSKVPVLDLTESGNFFSRTVGFSHDEIAGKKILFEFDPLLDYERVLRSIIVEAASNLERIVLFTRRESPIYSIVGEEPGIRLFILTSRVSYPRPEGESRFLLPAYDSSQILDSLLKTIEAYSNSSLTIIFDSVSHFILTLGTERAHSFVRQALELTVSNKITAVFLINSGAHDKRTVSMFESLFDLELALESGARVPEIRRGVAPQAY